MFLFSAVGKKKLPKANKSQRNIKEEHTEYMCS